MIYKYYINLYIIIYKDNIKMRMSQYLNFKQLEIKNHPHSVKKRSLSKTETSANKYSQNHKQQKKKRYFINSQLQTKSKQNNVQSSYQIVNDTMKKAKRTASAGTLFNYFHGCLPKNNTQIKIQTSNKKQENKIKKYNLTKKELIKQYEIDYQTKIQNPVQKKNQNLFAQEIIKTKILETIQKQREKLSYFRNLALKNNTMKLLSQQQQLNQQKRNMNYQTILTELLKKNLSLNYKQNEKYNQNEQKQKLHKNNKTMRINTIQHITSGTQTIDNERQQQFKNNKGQKYEYKTLDIENNKKDEKLTKIFSDKNLNKNKEIDKRKQIQEIKVSIQNQKIRHNEIKRDKIKQKEKKSQNQGKRQQKKIVKSEIEKKQIKQKKKQSEIIEQLNLEEIPQISTINLKQNKKNNNFSFQNDVAKQQSKIVDLKTDNQKNQSKQKKQKQIPKYLNQSIEQLKLNTKPKQVQIFHQNYPQKNHNNRYQNNQSKQTKQIHYSKTTQPMQNLFPISKSKSTSQQLKLNIFRQKLNIIGQTIGHGSKQSKVFKHYDLDWMLPCYFLYKTFYRLRKILQQKSKKLSSEGKVDESFTIYLNDQNIKIKQSLQKMRKACQKKHIQNKQISNILQQSKDPEQQGQYDDVEYFVQRYIKQVFQKKFSRGEQQNRSKVFLHLLQIVNSVLIIRELQGKTTNHLPTEILFAQQTKRNLQNLLQQKIREMRRLSQETE